MAAVDAAVDHGDLDVAAGGLAVQLGHVPVACGGLDWIEGVGARRLRSVGCGACGQRRHAFEAGHRLRPFHLRIAGQFGDDAFGVVVVRIAHDVAVQAQHRHGPVVHQGQAVLAGQLFGAATTGAASAVVDVAAAVAGVRTEMRGGQAQHHQQMMFAGIAGGRG